MKPELPLRAYRPAEAIYTQAQLIAYRAEVIEMILNLPQIKGNLFAERAIKELK